jgi:hypothetical protein
MVRLQKEVLFTASTGTESGSAFTCWLQGEARMHMEDAADVGCWGPSPAQPQLGQTRAGWRRLQVDLHM